MESYYPTIENSFSKEIQYKTTIYATEIIDTAGQDEFSILNSKHVRHLEPRTILEIVWLTPVPQFIGLHGYILVYSVANRQSFEMISIIRDKILNHLVRALTLPCLSLSLLSAL